MSVREQRGIIKHKNAFSNAKFSSKRINYVLHRTERGPRLVTLTRMRSRQRNYKRLTVPKEQIDRLFPRFPPFLDPCPPPLLFTAEPLSKFLMVIGTSQFLQIQLANNQPFLPKAAVIERHKVRCAVDAGRSESLASHTSPLYVTTWLTINAAPPVSINFNVVGRFSCSGITAGANITHVTAMMRLYQMLIQEVVRVLGCAITRVDQIIGKLNIGQVMNALPDPLECGMFRVKQ
jgi:hypothetical protein